MYIELKTKSKKTQAMLEQYVNTMVKQGASDFMLFPGEPAAYRINGVIERSDEMPLSAKQVGKLAKRLFGRRNLKLLGRKTGVLRGTASLATGEDGRPGDAQRVLIAASRSQGGITLAGRTIPWGMPTPEKIRLPQAVLDAIDSQMGLVIFCGATGSGKTTAAASALDWINENRSCHICLVGEPVEFTIEPKRSLLQYKNAGVDVPDLAAGMEAGMAQDLDVLYLQEIRDLDGLEMCMATCLTGHLVLTVMHATCTADAVSRVLCALPEGRRDVLQANFAEALRCIVALRLLPRAGGKGRVAAYDVLVPDNDMREMIARQGSISAWEGPLPGKCSTFRQSIGQLKDEGLISEEVCSSALSDLPS